MTEVAMRATRGITLSSLVLLALAGRPALDARQVTGGVAPPQGQRPPLAGQGAKPQPQQPPPPLLTTGLIVGRVIDAATGRPVSGAIVQLNGGTPPTQMPVQPGQPRPAPITPPPAPRFLTDGEGRFAFRHLTRGSFALTATKSGYADGAYGRFRPGGPSRSIQLADNERAGEIAIRVFKYAVIAGTVVDDAGEPVVGAQMRAYRRVLQSGRRALSLSGGGTTTDDRGMYRFSSLLPGEYVIALPMVSTTVPAGFRNDGRDQNLQLTMNTPGSFGYVGEGGRQVTPDGRFLLSNISSSASALSNPIDPSGRVLGYATQYYPAATTVAQATVIRVASGEERTGTDLVMRLQPTANISGMLVGPEGPGSNYVLHLVPSETDDLSFDPDVATAVTDPTGAFMFLAVPAGQYVIQTSRVPEPSPGPPPPPPPGASVRTEQTNDPSGRIVVTTTTLGPGGQVLSVNRRTVSPPMLWTAMPLALGGENIDGLTLTLQPGYKISGRVEFAGAAERPNAQRLAQIPVVVEPADSRQRSNFQQPGRLNADGTFTVGGLLPGKYLVRIGSAPGGWTMQSAMHNGTDISDLPLDLADRDATGVIVTFTDRTSDLRGTVRGLKEDDEPPAVILYPSDTTAWKNFGVNPRRMRMTRASPAGTFSFGTVPSGDYYLVAIPDEYGSEWSDPAYLDVLTRVAARISIGEGEKKIQDTEVKDVRPPGGGEPLVAVANGAGGRSLAEASWPIAPDVPAGEGGPFVTDQTPVTPQARDRVVVDPIGTGSISGVVVLDDGTNRPLRRARVSVRAPEMRNERMGMTDDEGRFVIDWLAPGQYTVLATKPAHVTGYHGAQRPGRGPGTTVPLAAGQKLTGVTVKVARGGVISGMVLDQSGQPLSGARLRLMQFQRRDGERVLVNSGGSGNMTTDDRGMYRIYGLMPGAYAVGVTPSTAGGTQETRLLSDAEMRAALADLARKASAPPPAAIPAGPAAPLGGPVPGGRLPPAPPGPLPVAPVSGRAVGFATVYYPGTVIDTDAATVTVGLGQEVQGIDLTVMLVPTSRVGGTVVMPDGRAALRPQVQLWPITATTNSSPTLSARMMPDGTFQAIGVAPGRYSLYARVTEQPTPTPPPPGAGNVPLQMSPGQAGLNYWALQELVLNGDDQTGLVLTLAPGMTVSGRVVLEGTSPPPDPGTLRLSLDIIGSTRAGYSSKSVQADRSGAFTFTSVIPGKYRLNAFPQNSATAAGWFVKSAVLEGRDAFELPFEVHAGRNLQGAVVTMTDQGTELSGTITDAKGAPVPALQILLFPTDRAFWTTTSRRMRGSIRPGLDGKYRVINILPGEYYLAAVTDLEPGDWGDPAFMEQVAAASIKLTFVLGEKKVQDLRTSEPQNLFLHNH